MNQNNSLKEMTYANNFRSGQEKSHVSEGPVKGFYLFRKQNKKDERNSNDLLE